MANYFFEAVRMASSHQTTYLQSVKFEASSTPTVATNGMIVNITDPCTNIWGTNDLTCWKATAPAADTDRVHILDILESPYVTNGDKTYRIGQEIVSISAPAGCPVRARKPVLDDDFIVGEDLFVSAPTEGQYAITTAGDTKYTPSASVVSNKFCVKIVRAETKNYGVSGSITTYRCKVVTSV